MANSFQIKHGLLVTVSHGNVTDSYSNIGISITQRIYSANKSVHLLLAMLIDHSKHRPSEAFVTLEMSIDFELL